MYLGLKKAVLILPILMVVIVLLNIPVTSAATTANKQKGVEKIQEEITKSKSALNEATSGYQNSLSEIQAIDARIYESEFELTYLQDRLESLNESSDRILVYTYTTSPTSSLSIPAFSQNCQDLMLETSIVPQIIKRDFEARALEAKLIQCKLELAKAKKERNQQLVVAAEKDDQRYRQLALQSAAVAKLNRKIASAKRKRSARYRMASLGRFWARARYLSRGTARIDLVFPVAEPNSYINSWGFSRSGGRRHQGTDIMAARGTAVFACVSGTIDKTMPYNRGLGGITIWLRGDDGNAYYYAHLNSIADGISPGTRVTAGQIIGTVGSTGNASGGSPHLHFEIHPGGGSAINPYPILRSAQ